MNAVTKEKVECFDRILSAAKKAALSAHIHADGDAIGSCSALLHYLRECRGSDAHVALPDRDAGGSSFLIPEEDRSFYHFHQTDPADAEAVVAAADLVILLDCNGFNRTEGLDAVLSASRARKVLIDHHLNPDVPAFDLVFSEVEISSASELLFHLLAAMPDIAGDAARLPAHSAMALMTGMTTDTNNFANSVYPSTFGMASQLLAAGVDRDAILSQLYNSYRENRLRVMGFLLGKMTLTPEGAAYMILTKRNMSTFGISEGETEGFVNLPLAIREVRLSVFLKQDAGYFRVSTRSKKGTSAQQFAARYFGGGGHENAAGGRLYFSESITSIKDVVAYLENALNEFLS
jgi:phosphoesterase RecJ-like protein